MSQARCICSFIDLSIKAEVAFAQVSLPYEPLYANTTCNVRLYFLCVLILHDIFFLASGC